MSIIDKANEYIGHPREVDEGYEVSMRRTAYAQDYQDAIDKACKCYCDDICDKGRCGMCFHKHDGKGQVKNTFRYNECNELKLIRKAMEE